MKRKKTQKHALKIQKKKAIKSLRKKVNKQKRKIRKRSEAAKILKSKKHNRRFSDQLPPIPSIARVTKNNSVILPFNFGHCADKALLAVLRSEISSIPRIGQIKSILGPDILIATKAISETNETEFDDSILDQLEAGVERNRKALLKLEEIKIGNKN